MENHLQIIKWILRFVWGFIMLPLVVFGFIWTFLFVMPYGEGHIKALKIKKWLHSK